MPTDAPAGEASSAAVSLGELTSASLRVGCLGFGGPAGQIALMHRVFVEEKKWIDEARYLHALNYCMLLPGPEAQQLATYVGWLLRGTWGGVIAGALFVLPGALVVFGLSWLYAEHADVPAVAALFYGIKAAVLAFVVEALMRIGKRALKTRVSLLIAAAAFVALFAFGAPFPLVIIGAGAFGLIQSLSGPPMPVEAAAAAVSVTWRRSLLAALVWGALWLAPLGLVIAMLGQTHVLAEVGLLFSQLAVVTFGGAYAVLAYLQQQAVEGLGWISTAQMVDGLGLAETTPGPLILVNQYVGFLAGWQTEGGSFWLATLCALMASWCTFAPSFVWIFAGAPYAERLRRNRYAAAALASITAAVLGVIAHLAIWFAQHVVFTRDVEVATPWGRTLALPEATRFDPYAAFIAALAAVALVRFKANAVLVIVASALAGWAVRTLV